MTSLLVAVAGALGALARYHLSGLVATRQRGPFPLSTLLVNVSGSLALGWLVGATRSGALPESTVAWAGTGFLGAFTTFSTFTYETLRLVQDRAWGYAGWNIALSGPLSFSTAALGYLLAA